MLESLVERKSYFMVNEMFLQALLFHINIVVDQGIFFNSRWPEEEKKRTYNVNTAALHAAGFLKYVFLLLTLSNYYTFIEISISI